MRASIGRLFKKGERKQKEFNALYYPYTRIENVDTLKRALLLYDKIYLIYPTKYYERIGISHDEGSFHEHHHFFEDTIRENFFEIVSPRDIAGEYEDIMLEAYEDDLKDQAALKYAPNKDWWIYEEKVPDTILDHPTFYKYRERGSILKLPFAQGESIMISQAILSAQKFDLTPVTDDPIHQYFLEKRLERGLKLYNSPQYRDEEMRQMELELRAVNDIIERKNVEMILPSLVDVEINTIINFREDNKEYLTNFRSGMAKLTSTMRSSLGDREFRREIVKIIEGKIKPMYDELEKDSRISARDFIYNIVTSKYAKIASVTTPGALVFGAFQTLPLWLGLLTSAGVFFGFEYAKEVLEKDKKLKQNYLTYLLKVEKML
jgi:hypothetical protein